MTGKKIALVNSSKKVSGAEEYLLDIADSIVSHGYSPSFYAWSGGVLEERARSRNVPCYSVFSANPLRIPFAIAGALRDDQPDIILIGRDHNIYPVVAGYLLARPFLRKKPTIVAALHTPTGRSYPLAVNFLDGVIATSEYTGSTFYNANSGWEERAATIYCGIRLPPLQIDKENPDRQRRVLKGRSFPVIGMVGELWKNQTELIDAGALLVRSIPDITIAIVGGGEDGDLREKISRFGLERNFVLTGRIPREQIPDLFFDLDLSVSTHRNEGFGIVHIESLAASTPVIAYNSGGLTEIIRKGGGMLVDGGIEQFTNAISSLLADRGARLELGREGRTVVENHFTLEVMTRNHVDFFQKLGGRA